MNENTNRKVAINALIEVMKKHDIKLCKNNDGFIEMAIGEYSCDIEDGKKDEDIEMFDWNYFLLKYNQIESPKAFGVLKFKRWSGSYE